LVVRELENVVRMRVLVGGAPHVEVQVAGQVHARPAAQVPAHQLPQVVRPRLPLVPCAPSATVSTAILRIPFGYCASQVAMLGCMTMSMCQRTRQTATAAHG
jgi:hypothetical protein